MKSLQTILLNKSAKPAKPTFISFVPTNGDGVQLGDSNKNEENSFHEKRRSNAGAIALLPDEIEVGRAEDVSQTQMCGSEQDDPVGTLLVTNYRIMFIPGRRSPASNKADSARRNKLIGLDDIRLSNVAGVYQVTKGKRRKLLPNTFMSGNVKRLQLHCKDFRLHQFCFKNSLRDHIKVVVNAILHHYFPVNVEHLFAFTYTGVSPDNHSNQPDVPEFFTSENWEIERKRLGASGFSVSTVNKGFALSDSLPESFVLPLSLTDILIAKSDLGFNNRCVPVWAYSHSNGCALIRMASGQPETELLMGDYVKRSHPKLSPPIFLDLNSMMLPSLKKLQMSFEQLRELCMPPTYKELFNSETSWFSMLDASQWLYFISTALNIANEIVIMIASKNMSVIIKERDGNDYNALISSLVQLLLDPVCRTIAGYQTLIEKEWVALGHRFSQRCDVVSTKEAEQSPVFLLFLDCTWQLLQQFPSSFEFTEIFLISIWDSIGLAMFRNFIFNGPQEQSTVLTSLRLNQKSAPMNVWDWSTQFLQEDIEFFTNPLFTAAEQIQNLRAASEKSTNLRRNEHFRRSRILVPCSIVAGLKFWENCYLRWLAPLEINGGGKPSEYIAQSLVMDEVASLLEAISELEDAKTPKQPNDHRQNRPSKFVFGHTSSVLRRDLSKHVSSSYPFSPTQFVTQSLLLPVPSPDSRTSVIDDTASVDELSIADVSET